jgi:hypothetical protein
MWRFRRRDTSRGDRAGAVVEAPGDVGEEFDGSSDQLWAEIERLTEANRARPDRETERRLLRLRHLAGIRLVDVDADAQFPAPDDERLREAEVLPEFARDELTPGLLRAGILRDGCLLVRGLVDRDDALRFAAQIDRAFAERDRQLAGEPAAEGYYEEFETHPRYPNNEGRGWIKAGGGLLAADAPTLTFEMIELFESAGVRELVRGYLGEPPLISVHKTTLRKAEPATRGAWHQDGNFMGKVRALNLWLSLSRCGDESPGLDIVPRRLEHLLPTKTEEAFLDIQISQSKTEAAAGDTPIMRPIFEPGDALFFDELFLHQTGSDPSMPKPRYAIESWFFGASGFPDEYAPVAV